MGKKDPYKFTIGFDKNDPEHVYVSELLNSTDKKAKLIVEAILVYEGKADATGISERLQSAQLRTMIQEIIREEVRNILGAEKDSEKETKEISEMNLTVEAPLPMDQEMIQNVTDAMSAFRRF